MGKLIRLISNLLIFVIFWFLVFISKFSIGAVLSLIEQSIKMPSLTTQAVGACK